MNTHKYEAFIKTVELGSLTKAANYLGYTQSGISHMINALEEELCTTLLLRDRSGVKITPEGTQLLPHIRNICNSYRDLIDKANKLHGLECGMIRIGTFTSIACHWLPVLIKTFQEKHPNIDFELLHGDYSEIENWVNEGRIDFGFLRLPSIAAFENIMLKQDKLMVILPKTHPLAEVDSFPVEKLSEEPFILLEEGTDNGITHIFEENHIIPNVRFKVRDDYTIMSMVESGLGISILPELVLYRNPYHIVMKELNIHAYRKLGIVLKNTKQASTAVKCFLDYISDALKKDVKNNHQA